MRIRYFASTIMDGNMNCMKRFYQDGMTSEDIRNDFNHRRYMLGKRCGFDGFKVLTAIQKFRPNLVRKTEEEKIRLQSAYDSKYPDGHAVFITKDMIEGYRDLYDLDIFSDILMMDSSISHLALAQPVADCPVVFAEDVKNHVVGLAHCGGEHIDRGLPFQLVDAVCNQTGCSIEDIHVFIGPHIQKESYTYDCYPPFIFDDERFHGALYFDKGVIHIDLRGAIMKQLLERGVSLSHITYSRVDTFTDARFYSNCAAQFDSGKNGRFYTGCFYEENPRDYKVFTK